MEQGHFLVMDDEELVHQVIDRVVERRRLGVRLIHASCASDADEILGEGGRFAGMLLDVYVPDGNGFDVLSRARRLPQHKSTPALLMTGAPDVSMFNRAYDLDAEVITKPVDEFDRLARFFQIGSASAAASWGLGNEDARVPNTLDGCIDRLRELRARYLDPRTRYLIGATVAALKARPDLYGPNAVCLAAAATGEDLPSLYRHATVADRWTLPEFEELLARRGPEGFHLKWSHFVFLATIASRAARECFAERAVANGLCLRDLQALVARPRSA